MTNYYLRTPAGEEGPFSIGELKNKAITSETLACSDGISWTPAGKIEALRSLFPKNSSRLDIKKRIVAPDGSTEGKTRSKISILQLATVILIALNGLVYYYKGGTPPDQKTAAASVAAPEPETMAVESTVQPAQEPVVQKTDTLHRIRNNWPEYITASHNDFKLYTKLGGIHRLQAIIQNKTDYPLDTVKVAVKYIRHGETFKTEHIAFYNIPERGEVSIPAPNSKSGSSVILDITEITSEKLNFHFSSGISADGKEDPFFRMP